MQLDIRRITTTVRPLEPVESAATRVNVEELAQLVAAEIDRARTAAAGRGLMSDDPAGELRPGS